MNKTVNAIIVVIVVVAAGWYLLSMRTPAGMGANDTIATVDGTAITRAELTAEESQLAAQNGASATSTAMQAQFQSVALDALIGKTLLMQGAQKVGITASSTEVDAQLAAMKANFSSPDDYQKALVAQGLTEDGLRTEISQNLVITSYLDQQLKLSATTATDAEIKAAYDQATKGTGTSTPPLSTVRDQVSQMVIQQKQQSIVDAYVTQLRSAADVKILIATSTPAV